MGDWTVAKVLRGELGWKTLAAAVSLVALVFAQHFGWVTPEQFDQFVKLAEALGLVGLRDAMTKLPTS